MCLTTKKVSEKIWHPIHLLRGGPGISHLFFANDVLLFAKASTAQMQIMTNVLADFCNAFGLKFNVDKSRVMCSRNVQWRIKHDISQLFPIKFASSPGKYLRFPLIQGRVKRPYFNFIIDRIQSRLTDWKQRLLNKLGRDMLAQAVISSTPTYAMQIFWLPQSICNGINKLIRNFIWGRSDGESGLYLVNWESVSCPRRIGGLGIQDTRAANVALLGKASLKSF